MVKEIKEALNHIKGLVQNLEVKIESLKVEEENKFVELKEAYKNGALIEYLHPTNGWTVVQGVPYWFNAIEYRIKPEEEKPKAGDVCKFWNYDENVYAVARLEGVRENAPFPYSSDISILYKNAKKLTKEEAIMLLFGKEENNE